MLIPRGKYSLDMYSRFLKLHGKTHDYKINYTDFNRAFVLPIPDGVHMIYVIALNAPVRQGQTNHYYLAMKFKKDKSASVTINMEPADILRTYGENLSQEVDGELYDVLSRLFKSIIKIPIIVPSGF